MIRDDINTLTWSNYSLVGDWVSSMIDEAIQVWVVTSTVYIIIISVAKLSGKINNYITTCRFCLFFSKKKKSYQMLDFHHLITKYAKLKNTQCYILKIDNSTNTRLLCYNCKHKTMHWGIIFYSTVPILSSFKTSEIYEHCRLLWK